jgi:hypothetical protein
MALVDTLIMVIGLIAFGSLSMIQSLNGETNPMVPNMPIGMVIGTFAMMAFFLPRSIDWGNMRDIAYVLVATGAGFMMAFVLLLVGLLIGLVLVGATRPGPTGPTR